MYLSTIGSPFIRKRLAVQDDSILCSLDSSLLADACALVHVAGHIMATNNKEGHIDFCQLELRTS